jgi:hypothetical protein
VKPKGKKGSKPVKATKKAPVKKAPAKKAPPKKPLPKKGGKKRVHDEL